MNLKEENVEDCLQELEHENISNNLVQNSFNNESLFDQFHKENGLNQDTFQYRGQYMKDGQQDDDYDFKFNQNSNFEFQNLNVFTSSKLQDQFIQYEDNINSIFDQNMNEKVDKRELTCIEEELLESSPSKSILTDGVSRAFKKELSRLSKLDDKKKEFNQLNLSVLLINKLNGDKISNSNSLTGSRLQEHLFNQIKSITNIEDQNFNSRPQETQMYDEKQYMSDRTTKQNLNEKSEKFMDLKNQQSSNDEKNEEDKQKVDNKIDLILDNSIESDLQKNESKNDQLANSLFQNNITNILCNQIDIDDSEQIFDQSQIFQKFQNQSEARRTGPQSDTKQSEPKKRNKSFNQWRKNQNNRLLDINDLNQFQISNPKEQIQQDCINEQSLLTNKNKIQEEKDECNNNLIQNQNIIQDSQEIEGAKQNINSFTAQTTEQEKPQLQQAFRSKSTKHIRQSEQNAAQINQTIAEKPKALNQQIKKIQEKQTLQDFIQNKQLFTQISTNHQQTQQSNQDLLGQLLGFKDQNESSQLININDLVSQKNSIEQVGSALNMEKLQSDNLEFDSSVKSEKHLHIQNLNNVQHHIPLATTQKHASNNRFGTNSGLGQYQISLSKNLSINIQKFDDQSKQNDSVLTNQIEENFQSQKIYQQQKNYFQKSDKKIEILKQPSQSAIETIKIVLSPQIQAAPITVQQLNNYHQEYLLKKQNKNKQNENSKINPLMLSPVLKKEINSLRKFTKSPIVSPSKANHQVAAFHKNSFLGSPILQQNKNFKYGISLNEINKQLQNQEQQKQKTKDNLSQVSRNKSRSSQADQKGSQNKQQKSLVEWHQICKVIDKIPSGASLKSRHTFTRSDIILLVSQYKKKIDDLQNLVSYEQQKFDKHTKEYSGMLEDLKELKIENKCLQQSLNQIKPSHEDKLNECLQMLRNSMIHNVVCLEFNKDLNLLMNQIQCQKQQNTNCQSVLKSIANLQFQHNIFADQEFINKQNENQKFENNIEKIEQFIFDTVQYLEAYNKQDKVLKIDLENMSSGSDSQKSLNSSLKNLKFNQNQQIKNNNNNSKDQSQDSISIQLQNNLNKIRMNNINFILEKSKSNGKNKNNQDTYSNQNASFIKNDNFHTMNSNILEGKESYDDYLRNQIQISVTPSNRSSKNLMKKQILKTQSQMVNDKISERQNNQSITENKHKLISQNLKSNEKKCADIQQSAIQKHQKISKLADKRSSNSKCSQRIQDLKQIAINPQKLTANALLKFEKIQMKLQSKELQYSVLLEKYEYKTKRVLELQDEIKQLVKQTNERELRIEFQKQIEDLENIQSKYQFQNESLQKQLKQTQTELYQSQQHEQNSLNQIMYLNETLRQQHDLLEKNDNIAELQNAVISLFNQQISKDSDSISLKDQKMLRIVFGDGFLIKNTIRDSLVKCKQLACFLLNDIIIKMLDYFENQNKKIQMLNAQISSQTQGNQHMKSVQESSQNFNNYLDQNIENIQIKQSLIQNNNKEKEIQIQNQKNRKSTSIGMHYQQNQIIEISKLQKNQKEIQDYNDLFQNINLFNIQDEPQEEEKKDSHLQSNFAERKQSVNRIQSPDVFTNRSNNSSHRFKKSRIHSKSAIGINSQINILKCFSSQIQFLSQIKLKLQETYELHDEFKEYLENDQQKESLFRHMSLNTNRTKYKDLQILKEQQDIINLEPSEFKKKDYYDQKSQTNLNQNSSSLQYKNDNQMLETEISLRVPQTKNYQLNLNNLNKCSSVDLQRQEIDFDTDRQNYEDSQQENLKSLKEIATSISKINDSDLNIQMLTNNHILQKSTIYNGNQNYINLKSNAGISIGSCFQNESIQTNDMEKSISPVKQIDEEAECTDINEEDFVHDYNQNSNQGAIQTPPKNSKNQSNFDVNLNQISVQIVKINDDIQNESKEFSNDEKQQRSIPISNYSTQNQLNLHHLNLNSKVQYDIENKYKNQYISRKNIMPKFNEQDNIKIIGKINYNDQFQGSQRDKDRKSKYINQGNQNMTLPQNPRRENISSPLSNISTTQVVQLNLKLKSDNKLSK